MSERDQPLARVGVREMRQNLSVYLRRVKEGETLEVTEHGQPVARLTPNPPRKLSRVEQLIAEGRATEATGDLLDVLRQPPLEWPEGASSATEILIQMRDEERY